MLEGRTQSEILKLIAIFLVWKTFLLVVAHTSPGPGYDTSTTLLGEISTTLPSRLARWDAIYFTKVAQRDYVFEQEWAFGWGYTRILKTITSFFNQPNHKFPLVETWSGIIISHLSHLFSVWALYDTSRRLFQYLPGSTNLPYLASVLHTISPAGLFLSGPYAESLFSCFSFLAYNLYVRSALCEEDSLRKELYQLISALLLSISTTIRTNGLLNGLLFVSEAFYGCSNLLHRRPNFKLFRRLIMICICGYVVGCGYLIPQYIAYQEYCSSSTTDPRPWCKAKLPSIYNFVQSYYWNAGLFEYWTVSNLPLFMLAAPCIAFFVASSRWVWSPEISNGESLKALIPQEKLARRILKTLALPQIALTILLLTIYHVQIITRLSSGYLVWYWWIAKALCKPKGTRERWMARSAVIWMVLYGAIQGALYAAFLPPA